MEKLFFLWPLLYYIDTTEMAIYETILVQAACVCLQS